MAQVKKPYLALGNSLKSLRERTKKSISEVAGAIEVEEKYLRKIEEGVKKPSIDLMLLIISYFNMPDKEALKLWSLAKYRSELSDHIELASKEDLKTNEDLSLATKSMVMFFSMDVRTMYSDGVEVKWNSSGLTINFTQAGNASVADKPITVANVGMSYEQAAKVVSTLQTALLHAKYMERKKLLPPGVQ